LVIDGYLINPQESEDKIEYSCDKRECEAKVRSVLCGSAVRKQKILELFLIQ